MPEQSSMAKLGKASVATCSSTKRTGFGDRKRRTMGTSVSAGFTAGSTGEFSAGFTAGSAIRSRGTRPFGTSASAGCRSVGKAGSAIRSVVHSVLDMTTATIVKSASSQRITKMESKPTRAFNEQQEDAFTTH